MYVRIGRGKYFHRLEQSYRREKVVFRNNVLKECHPDKTRRFFALFKENIQHLRTASFCYELSEVEKNGRYIILKEEILFKC